MYKVFNHWAGVYEEVESVDHAKVRYKELINDFVFKQALEKIPAPVQIWDQDCAIAAAEYERIFGEVIQVSYSYTVFDIDNGVIKARCFYGANSLGKQQLVKVGSNSLLEVYEASNEEPNQISFTYDLDSKSKKFKYFIDGTVFIKKDAVTGEVLATTNIGVDLPSDKIALLNNYPEIKNKVTQHGQREYGYIVEYPEESVLIDNPNIEAQKAAALSDIKSRVNVITESADEAGLITTQVVDTTDW